MLMRDVMRRPLYEQPGGGGGGNAPGGNAGGNAPGGGNAPAGAGDPWWEPHRAGLDKDTLSYLDGKKFPGLIDALKSGAQSDRMARDRNVVAKPDLAKLGEWEGLGLFGYDADVAKYGAKIKPPKQPNDGAHDAGLFDVLVKSAHKRFVPPAMAEGLMQDLSDAVNARLSEAASKGIKDREALETALRNEWGADYDAKLEGARRAAKALGFGADEASELEKITGSPRLVKIFAGMAARFKEGELIDDPRNGGNAMTPATAAAELRRLEGDAEWLKVFSDRSHPQNADYKAQWQKLADLAAKDPDWQKKQTVR